MKEIFKFSVVQLLSDAVGIPQPVEPGLVAVYRLA